MRSRLSWTSMFVLVAACGSDVVTVQAEIADGGVALDAGPPTRVECVAAAGTTTRCSIGRCDLSIPADALTAGATAALEELALPAPLTTDALAPFLCSLSVPAALGAPATVTMNAGVPLPENATLFEYAAPTARAVDSSIVSGTTARALIATGGALGITQRVGSWSLEVTAPSDPLASVGSGDWLRNISLQSITAAFWDGRRLYVGDGPRVLVYDGIPSDPGVKPTLVLGQPELDRIVGGVSASVLTFVYAIWSDGTRLAVANGNRILVWNTIPTTSFAPADLVLGQQDFVSNDANGGGISASTLNGPAGIDSDGTRLLVADTFNHRVLSWAAFPTRIGQAATSVLGQPTFASAAVGNFYQAWGAKLDGAGALTSSFYTGTHHFASLATGTPSDFSPFATGVAGRVQPEGPTNPTSITRTAPGGLAVFDGIGRIAMQRTSATSARAMDFVLGQPDATRALTSPVSASTVNPQGRLIEANGRFLVPDLSRLLVWDATPTYTFEPAHHVIGQAGFTTNDRGIDYRHVSGRTLGYPADVATGGDLVAVADRGNNRVVLYRKSTLGAANTEATVVLGQRDAASFLATPDRASASTLSGPSGVALDGSRLIVADTENHRVLVWSPPPTSPGAPATFVLGQSDFSGHRPNRGRGDADRDGYSDASADGMFAPTGVVSDGTHLFVSDRMNHRVLVWDDLASLANGKSADRVIGQPSFTAVEANRGNGAYRVRPDSLDLPTGLTLDGTTLWVADTENNRVVRWDSATTSASAGLVLGQADGFTLANPNYYPENSANAGTPVRPATSATSILRPRGVAIVGNALYVSETDSHRVHVFERSGADWVARGQLGQTTSGGAAPNAGGIGPAALSAPLGIAAAGTELLVADSGNHRVVGYSVTTIPTTALAATRFLGQPSGIQNGFNQSAATTAGGATRPRGSVIQGGELLIAEAGRHRVVVQELPLVPGREPKRILGQPNFGLALPNAGGAPSASTLVGPRAVHADASRIVVADTGNNRVLVFDRTGASAASLVLGQASFESTQPNRGGAPGAATLSGPEGVFVDGQRLVIADTGNHRVLVWTRFPTESGQAADLVLGQADFAGALTNRGTGMASATSLASPTAIDMTGGRLLVADTGNNRVLAFDLASLASGGGATIALGQPDLVSRAPAASSNDSVRLAGPVALASDGTNLYVGDRDANRILTFDLATLSSGAAAVTLFNANSGLSVAAPAGLAVETLPLFGSRLYIADTNNDRVLAVSPVSRLR